MIAAAALVTVADVYMLVRDRAMSMRKFPVAQLAMLFGKPQHVAE